MRMNTWCEALGIEPPDLAAVKDHGEANTYARLIVALLESGEPMTLLQIAQRFEEVGIADSKRALRSLQRCKPGRPPVYRDEDHYSLDPYDDQLDLWTFRLGLRPPSAPQIEIVRPAPAPLPGDEVPLTIEELDEAWKNANLSSWSSQRMTLAVLDAHQARSMAPQDVVAFIGERTQWHKLGTDSSKFRRKGCPIAVEEDGRWGIMPANTEEGLRAMRRAVRALIESARDRAMPRYDPAIARARQKAFARKRAAHARELEAMSRALLVASSTDDPRAVALLDVGRRSIETFLEEELDALRARVDDYDIIGAQEVRTLLRHLGIDASARRLAELDPPQKTRTVGRSKTLKITTTLLAQGSCGIKRPFGDPKKLEEALAKGEETKVRRRLEADAKSLYALYEYGRLHGAVRLRRSSIDERLPVPWVHSDERTLYAIKGEALDQGRPLEIVTGKAPKWGDDPWARAHKAFVRRGVSGWGTWIVDEEGYVIEDADVQRARIVGEDRDSHKTKPRV